MDQGDVPAIHDPVIDAYRSGVDLSLLRANLNRSVEERFLRLMEMQRFAAELRRAGRQATSGT
jgi:hypothetical protein